MTSMVVLVAWVRRMASRATVVEFYVVAVLAVALVYSLGRAPGTCCRSSPSILCISLKAWSGFAAASG